jgi:hypothetical protein
MRIVPFATELGAIHKILTHLAAKGPMGTALPARLSVTPARPDTLAPAPAGGAVRPAYRAGFCASRGRLPASFAPAVCQTTRHGPSDGLDRSRARVSLMVWRKELPIH